MALPAVTIHQSVRLAGRQFAKSANPTLKRWGPTSVGLAIVPFLPYLFDEPVSWCEGGDADFRSNMLSITLSSSWKELGSTERHHNRR